MARSPRPPLAGRVALVTGGAVRVGRSIVEALAEAGAGVAIHAHRHAGAARALAARLRRAGREAVALEADLRDAQACRALPGRAVEALGRLDVLVNSAGAFEATDPRSADADAWDRLLAVNARPLWLVTSAAAPFLEATRGCVVSVLCASARTPWAGHLPYSAGKAAAAALTAGFAKALAPRVRVNAVAPGPVLAPPGASAAARRAAVASTVLGRWGRPRDVADAVVFLAAHAPFTTGAVLPVDGGRHLRG